ncbi:unnamed protein product [Dibothriocephalus latus]|uniref:Uncharacterized protein n=1 Tax=Dibothriocephalus latus TaxID=60516 RepID=A0A3P7LVF4_DIBLA|nr:unnamed protein product [Dibothriocephalus latus]
MLSPWGFNSDMLIVKICNAADIIELLAYLEDKSTHWIVYLKKAILYIWHISLLQFGFIATSADVFSSSSIREPPQRPTRIQSNQHNDLPQPGISDTNEEGTNKKRPKKKKTKNKQRHKSNSLPEADAEAGAETVQAEASVQGEASIQEEASAQAEASVQGESSAQAESSVQARRDCGCHFYVLKGVLGEILVSIMVQDVPFLILRFTMYFKFNMHSLQAVCFTIKNIMFLVVHVVQAATLLRRMCCNKQ